MVGLFLKQVSPEFLLLELWALSSQTLCIKNCSLARNGANGSTAACSSPLLGLPTYFSILRMRWKHSCTLVALSQLQFLQLSSFPLHLQAEPELFPPSIPFRHDKQFVPVQPLAVQLAGSGALHRRGRWLQACCWGSLGQFARWVTEQDIALGSLPECQQVSEYTTNDGKVAGG